MVASRYELCGFHWKCCIQKFWRYLLTTAAFSLLIELTIDESDSNRFIILLCRSSDSSYNSTDSLLVTVGYQLRFLALLCTRSADLACTWYSPTLTIRTSIIWTWDIKKMQGQSAHCDHVTCLRMRSKPMLHSCHSRTSCCSAIKLTLKEVAKRNTR